MEYESMLWNLVNAVPLLYIKFIERVVRMPAVYLSWLSKQTSNVKVKGRGFKSQRMRKSKLKHQESRIRMLPPLIEWMHFKGFPVLWELNGLVRPRGRSAWWRRTTCRGCWSVFDLIATKLTLHQIDGNLRSWNISDSYSSGTKPLNPKVWTNHLLLVFSCNQVLKTIIWISIVCSKMNNVNLKRSSDNNRLRVPVF